MNPADIEWGPITEEGKALLEEAAIREYNEIAREYGAKPIPLKRAEPAPQTYFKVQSVLDVIRRDVLKWRIKGVVPEQGIGAIYGPSGSAKSFLALDMAVAISKGYEWFGHKTKSCPVVYVCLEGEAGLANRVSASLSKVRYISQVSFIAQSLNLQDANDLKNLIRSIMAHGMSDGVVIIDTLNRASPGMDENSSAEMGRVIHAVKQVQEIVGGFVMLVHHTGKDAAKGMRGHSSLFAALDAAIEVKRTGEFREWCVAKAKDGEDGKTHPFKLEVVSLGEDNDGDPISSCVIDATPGPTGQSKPLTQSQKRGMDAFFAAASKKMGADNFTFEVQLYEWREEFYATSPADNIGAKQRSFLRVRNDLLELGQLVVHDDIYRLPQQQTFFNGQRT